MHVFINAYNFLCKFFLFFANTHNCSSHAYIHTHTSTTVPTSSFYFPYSPLFTHQDSTSHCLTKYSVTKNSVTKNFKIDLKFSDWKFRDWKFRDWKFRVLKFRDCILTKHSVFALQVKWHPKVAWLITAGIDRTVRAWDAKSGASLVVWTGHTEMIMGLSVSPDGKYVVSASDDSTARIWDLPTN
jgi:WD40 repeat protein